MKHNRFYSHHIAPFDWSTWMDAIKKIHNIKLMSCVRTKWGCLPWFLMEDCYVEMRREKSFGIDLWLIFYLNCQKERVACQQQTRWTFCAVTYPDHPENRAFYFYVVVVIIICLNFKCTFTFSTSTIIEHCTDKYAMLVPIAETD